MNYSNEQQLSNRKQKMGQLRKILKEYGSVGVAFHTTISLASLGTCYMIVKRYSVLGKMRVIDIPYKTIYGGGVYLVFFQHVLNLQINYVIINYINCMKIKKIAKWPRISFRLNSPKKFLANKLSYNM